MDLADASLVATAETLGIRQIFTLDSDFYVYRLHGTHLRSFLKPIQLKYTVAKTSLLYWFTRTACYGSVVNALKKLI